MIASAVARARGDEPGLNQVTVYYVNRIFFFRSPFSSFSLASLFSYIISSPSFSSIFPQFFILFRFSSTFFYVSLFLDLPYYLCLCLFFVSLSLSHRVIPLDAQHLSPNLLTKAQSLISCWVWHLSTALSLPERATPLSK